MPAPDLDLYDSTDTSVVTSITFTGVVPGTPSAAQEFHLWNSFSGASVDDAQNLILRVLARIPGDPDFAGDGLEILDDGSIEARIISGGTLGSSGSWVPLGAGRSIALPNMSTSDSLYLEFRVNPLAGHDTDAVEVAWRIDDQRSVPRVASDFLQHGVGVFLGVGHPGVDTLFYGGTVAENTVPDDDVLVGDTSWISDGFPVNELAHAETLDGDDGSAATLVAGESYVALIGASASGISITKGDKGTPGTAPDVPEGTVPLAWVLREFDAIINTADITDARVFGVFTAVNTSGLNVDIYPGSAAVGSFMINKTSVDTVVLTDAATNYVWLKESGGLGVTTSATRTDPYDLLLYKITTAGGVVTATEDRRLFRDVASNSDGSSVAHGKNSLVAGEKENVILDVRSPTVLMPGFPIQIWLDEPGTSSGTDYIWDIEYSDDHGTTWTTIFTSFATDDRRPTIAAASNWSDDAFPEVTVFNPGALLRLRQVQVASVNNDAAGMAVRMSLVTLPGQKA